MKYYVQFEIKNKIYGGNTMNNITDTNILMEDFDALLNDSRFLDTNDEDSIPYIADNIEAFLSKYIEFCQKIEIGRREKIRYLMSVQDIPYKNCQNTIVEKIQQMMDECGRELSDEEKSILKWNKKPNSSASFSSVPKKDAVKKWLSDTGARNPNRMYLYKIAFALGLKAYYPNEIYDVASDKYKISSEEYKTSVNYLFNKIYNQRYCTRTYYELIFIFCLKNGKNYLTAMKMIAQYLKAPKSDSIQLNGNENNTLYIVQQSSAVDESEFISFLVQITPLLNDKYSSVFSQLEEIIEYFSDEAVMQEFEDKYSTSTHMNDMLTAYDENKYIDSEYKSYMNLGEKVLISETVKKRLMFFDNRMKISSALFDYTVNSDNEDSLVLELNKLGISEALYSHIKNTASESISAKFGTDGQQYFSDIIDDVMITADNVYNFDIIDRTDNGDGTYSWQAEKKNIDISHEQIYRKLRKALITAHFFYYWSDPDSELSYDGYIKEIKQLLIDSFYQPMYIKNSFDCFFMLCAQTAEPIDSYYSVFNQIFYIYDDYQKEFISPDTAKEFEEYSKYTLSEKAVLDDIVELDQLHPVDQKDIQEEIIEIIKHYANRRDNN